MIEQQVKEELIDNDNIIENINEIEIKSIIVDKDKYLPKWVLEMRQKVETSRIAMGDVEKRIEIHIKNIGILDSVLKKSKNKTESEKEINLNPKTIFFIEFNKIPMDSLTFIFLYLSIKEVVKLENLSKSFRNIIKSAHGYWFEIFPIYIKTTNRKKHYFSNLRNIIISHHVSTNKILNFIKIMKDQRSVPKHNTIAPRRHSRHETDITHPLPIFDRNSYNEMIMSRSDTFNNDFRAIALLCLEDTFRITSNEDEQIHQKLFDLGAITVYISLLSNESGMLQELCCGIISNLLVWESRKNKKLKKKDISSNIKNLSNQLMMCNGVKLLLNLLTSPSASINLASSASNSNHNNIGKGTTASVQGMCNKEASRALVNLFCPLFPIPSNIIYNSDTINKSSNNNNNNKSPEVINSIFTTDESSKPWLFKYFHKSGGLKDETVSYLHFTPDGYIRGRGIDEIGGIFVITGKIELDIKGCCWLFDKSYIRQDLEGDISLNDWLMLASQEYVPLGGSGRLGKHVTQIGYWSNGRPIEKNHVNNNKVDVNYHNLLNNNDIIDNGDDNDNEKEDFVDGVPVNNINNSDNWGMCMYGVWEGASLGSHFDLEKGGVFIACPVFLD